MIHAHCARLKGAKIPFVVMGMDILVPNWNALGRHSNAKIMVHVRSFWGFGIALLIVSVARDVQFGPVSTVVSLLIVRR